MTVVTTNLRKTTSLWLLLLVLLQRRGARLLHAILLLQFVQNTFATLLIIDVLLTLVAFSRLVAATVSTLGMLTDHFQYLPTTLSIHFISSDKFLISCIASRFFVKTQMRSSTCCIKFVHAFLSLFKIRPTLSVALKLFAQALTIRRTGTFIQEMTPTAGSFLEFEILTVTISLIDWAYISSKRTTMFTFLFRFLLMLVLNLLRCTLCRHLVD